MECGSGGSPSVSSDVSSHGPIPGVKPGSMDRLDATEQFQKLLKALGRNQPC
jgi:hypothetical protein